MRLSGSGLKLSLCCNQASFGFEPLAGLDFQMTWSRGSSESKLLRRKNTMLRVEKVYLILLFSLFVDEALADLR